MPSNHKTPPESPASLQGYSHIGFAPIVVLQKGSVILQKHPAKGLPCTHS